MKKQRFSFIRYFRFITILTICFFRLWGINAFAQSVTLTWAVSQNPYISHYGIYRTIHLDSSFLLIGTVDHPDSMYIDETVELGLQYYYAATSVDQFSNESGFSNVVDTTLNVAVPVELTSFSVHLNDNDVILEWATATETNNFGFEVQRSQDSKLFERIGFVRGNGTTVEPKHYTFTDQNLTIGTYYYRLKQIDHDGTFEFSDIAKITIGVPNEFKLYQNYPNPFNPATTISYSLPKSSHVKLTIYNLNGQVIYTLVDEYQKAGQYTVKWRGIDQRGMKVSSGTYYYKIKTLDSAMFRRCVKVFVICFSG